MVGLIAGTVPVKGVTYSDLPVGVISEICDLVECSVQQWNTSQHGTQVADLFQTFTGKSRGEPSQAMIDLFLYESVAAI